jgi:hypothetical protein
MPREGRTSDQGSLMKAATSSYAIMAETLRFGTSEVGTFRTCRSDLTKSVLGARADIPLGRGGFRVLGHLTIYYSRTLMHHWACARAGTSVSIQTVEPLLFLAENPVKHTIAGPRFPTTRHLSSVHVVL